MMLERVALLAAPSSRSRLYIQQMMQNDLLPSHALLLYPVGSDKGGAGIPDPVLAHAREEGFDLDANLGELVRDAGISYEVLETMDPNHPDVVAAVAALEADVVVYSGPGGAILRKELLDTGKRFLHVHPGLVPSFRGSTTVYYSLLAEDNLGASAIYLEAKIDAGPVLMRKVYDPPQDRLTLDYFYDPFIRSDLLLDVLRHFAKGEEPAVTEQDPTEGETYYIIHPVLKHLAILAGE